MSPELKAAFDATADQYQRGRPTYSEAAVDFAFEQLELGPWSHVLDLASGGGKLTGALAERAASTIAVEPLQHMRRVFSASHPNIGIHEGSAEAIPMETSSVDAVFVGQAFHWFDPHAALNQIHRVTKPSGGMALLWNVRRDTQDWVKKVWDEIDPFDTTPRGSAERREKAVAETGLFQPLVFAKFPNPQKLTHEQVIARIESVSFVSALETRVRSDALDRIQQILETHPQTRSTALLDMYYETDVYCYARI